MVARDDSLSLRATASDVISKEKQPDADLHERAAAVNSIAGIVRRVHGITLFAARSQSARPTHVGRVKVVVLTCKTREGGRV